MKKIIKFFGDYRYFSLALVTGLVGLVLIITRQKEIADILIAIVSVAEVLPLLWDMWQDFRSGSYGIDILAATAIITSVVLGQYWAALVVVLMLSGGQSLEDYANKRAQSELDALLAHAPLTANVLKKNKIIKVNVEDIQVGDKVVIKAGEVVPVDAVIIEGQASFNESSLTGESLPVAKKIGDQLQSGSINIDSAVTAKAIATANESQYQQIIKLVKNAASTDAPFVRLANKYSLPFTLTSFAIAGAVWSLSGSAIRFLEVIIVATPCPLLLATPIALISGMARASRYGIIVKNGISLEKLADAKVFAFDKTGTLTTGEIKVDNVKTFGKLSADQILKLAASVEQNSNHILAQAIVRQAKAKGIKLEKVKRIEDLTGIGIRASIKADTIFIGGLNSLQNNRLKIPSDLKEHEIDKTVSFLFVNNSLEGQISFSDSIRPEAKKTLSLLKKLGIADIVLITGDNLQTADKVAKELGINEVYANQSPADKLSTLSKLKPKPVVFVGDGINDAPVLTSAGVGIAIGAEGSTAASESADMVIMSGNLSRVAVATEIAKKTFKIATFSIVIGIGLSFILMAVFATGKFHPVYGAILQEVVDVITIFNALRAHMIKPSMIDH
jgi:heavy metal translocating P-type ATPase